MKVLFFYRKENFKQLEYKVSYDFEFGKGNSQGHIFNDYKNLMEGDSKDPIIKSVTFENLRKKKPTYSGYIIKN